MAYPFLPFCGNFLSFIVTNFPQPFVKSRFLYRTIPCFIAPKNVNAKTHHLRRHLPFLCFSGLDLAPVTLEQIIRPNSLPSNPPAKSNGESHRVRFKTQPPSYIAVTLRI